MKDATHSLMDYLDPAATRRFVEWTFDAYAKAIGDELGRTVLGFRGDEPGYGFNPWTPRLLDEFQQRKGYDLRPYIGAFAAGPALRTKGLSDEVRRAYADYCDVWSDLFRDHYCNAEAAWCAAHGVEMQLHVEHEEILPQLAISDGDFFKCFREIQVPGVDIIWHQLWMDNPADFAKLASSAAHLYGRPRAMCEAFAAYRPPPNLKQARWLLDFLFSRGITRIEYMYWQAGGGGPRLAAATPNAGAPANPPGKTGPTAPPGTGGVRYYREPGFPAVAAYVNRLGYLLGEGRPAADIGLYLPSSSFWLASPDQAREIEGHLLALAHQLIEHQRDFDFVDEQALASVLRLEGDRLVNLSGQGYRAIIVPPALAMSRVALERLQAFARAGGSVIFIGARPALVAGRDFLHAKGPAEIAWASEHETSVAEAGNWAPIRFKSQPSRGGIVEDITYRNMELRDTRQAFEFELEWNMRINVAGDTRVPPIVRNVRLVDIRGTADSVGRLHGLKDSFIDGVVFENCAITAKRGLIIDHARNIDTTGLELHVAEGEPIMRGTPPRGTEQNSE